MKILIVSATEKEIAESRFFFLENKMQNHDLQFLVTGMGQLHSAFYLMRKLQNETFDLVMQVGLCGSVSQSVELGSLINIVNDQIIDLGASSNDGFIPFNDFMIENKQIVTWNSNSEFKSPILSQLPKGEGITANVCHGDSYWVDFIQKQHPSAFESMEGASFFMVTSGFSVPALQIRAVSNYVELRNTSHWKKDLAIQNLNRFIIDFCHEL
ncbi:MAG: hypothetical protein RBS19_09080 [Bacteroidales bacterium]|nr:hypothetical protein [Bacteroidales bacterium]